MSSIYEFVKEQRNDYRSLLIEITEGYEYSQYQTLRTIELYHNSRFETGNKDSLGREKPFYNINKFRTNVATRATDLDTKDITIFSDAADAETEAFLLTLKNRNWMKQSNLAAFLNRMGHTRAKYGGVLVKKTEQGGELGLHIMQWLNMITDQVDTNQAGLGQIAALMSDWNEQAQNVTSTYPAILGQTAQHGTSFRLQAGLVNEASALFEYRRQEAGLFIREIYRDWVLPFLVKQMQSAKDIVADLDPDELQMVSKAAAEHEALQFAKKQALTGAGALVHQQDIEAIKAATHSMHMKSSRKGINKFSGMFDNWAGTIDIDTTGEQRDKKDMLSTLFQLFGAVAANPQLLQDPTMARLFNEIVETAGVSPTLQTSGEQPGQGAQPGQPAPGQPANAPAPAQPAAPTPVPAATIPNVQTR